MPEQKQLKAGLEGLVRDGATSKTVSDNQTGAPGSAVMKTGKPASQSRSGDFGACCKFDTGN